MSCPHFTDQSCAFIGGELSSWLSRRCLTPAQRRSKDVVQELAQKDTDLFNRITCLAARQILRRCDALSQAVELNKGGGWRGVARVPPGQRRWISRRTEGEAEVWTSGGKSASVASSTPSVETQLRRVAGCAGSRQHPCQDCLEPWTPSPTQRRDAQVRATTYASMLQGRAAEAPINSPCRKWRSGTTLAWTPTRIGASCIVRHDGADSQGPKKQPRWGLARSVQRA